jgi:hypothetical protein
VEFLGSTFDAAVSFATTDANRFIDRPKNGIAVLASAAKMTSAVFHFLAAAIGATVHGSPPIEKLGTARIVTLAVETGKESVRRRRAQVVIVPRRRLIAFYLPDVTKQTQNIP